MQNVVGPTLVAMATKFGLGTEIESPTGLCISWSVCAAERVQQRVTSSLWFIVLLCVLALIFLILLIIFLIRYNRGAKYKVFEKEKRHGAKGGRLDEEDQFCEYVRRSVAFARSFCQHVICNGKPIRTGYYQEMDRVRVHCLMPNTHR